MSAPLKRVCRQAAQSRPRCSSTRKPPSRQWQEIRPSWTLCPTALQYQTRAYTHSVRRPASTGTQKYAEEDDFDDVPLPSESDLSSTAHAELNQHRELREMVRLAAWEMPLLAAFSKPFEPNVKAKEGEKTTARTPPLRWRYTTYFSDAHPASRKVVVEFRVGSLPDLTAAQKTKLKKLAGPRFNPETGKIRMSSESFETQAQNKRYLGDVVGSLLAECKDPEADTFADIPLDVRHHKFKQRLEFPEHWKVDAERRAELEEGRRMRLLQEGAKVEHGAVVDGNAAIEAARQISLKQVEQPVMAQAKQPLPKGKMGKKEMGQTRGSNR